MKIFSFDDNNNKIDRDPKQYDLFNLFQKNIVYPKNIEVNTYVVPREFEMRLDRISDYIYGSPDYVEELMVLNDIINPYSVKEGQYINYCSLENLNLLYVKDDMSEEKELTKQKIIDSSQPNREKEKRENDKNLPITIRPSNLEQIRVNDNTVQIINSFE